MIEAIKQFVVSADFVFAIIIIGFIVVVALLLLENRRDNQKLVQLNQKVKDLIAGDQYPVLYDRWRACDQPPGADYHYQRYGNQAVGS